MKNEEVVKVVTLAVCGFCGWREDCQPFEINSQENKSRAPEHCQHRTNSINEIRMLMEKAKKEQREVYKNDFVME